MDAEVPRMQEQFAAETRPNHAVRGYPGFNSVAYTAAPHHDSALIQ